MKRTLITLLSIISVAKSAIIASVEGNVFLINPTENPNINPVVNIQRPIQISNEEVVDIAESEDKKLDMVIVWDAEEEDIYDFYALHHFYYGDNNFWRDFTNTNNLEPTSFLKNFRDFKRNRDKINLKINKFLVSKLNNSKEMH